jgi:hypothetical protein
MKIEKIQMFQRHSVTGLLCFTSQVLDALQPQYKITITSQPVKVNRPSMPFLPLKNKKAI